MPAIYKFPYDSPIRYLPLVYILPYDLLVRCPILRSFGFFLSGGSEENRKT